ncbi:anthranilate synthase component I family protein [Aquifex pyrophilus]
MELILSGAWFGKRKLLKAEIKRAEFYESLEYIEPKNSLAFILLSYELSSEILNVKVKISDKPKVVYLELGELIPFGKVFSRNVSLYPKGSALTDEEFMERVSKVKEYIKRGDVYQINLTNRFDYYLEGSPLDLFLNFYISQPVPFGFFLNLNDFYVISGSMELFLEKRGNILRSKPIKGTSREQKYLKESQKERAENLMITDMMRNDLGRVCRMGSVYVKELFKVEKFKTLYHLVSEVRGETDKDFKEILLNTFPPASVTGAPKKRAVEIIDELEPFARGYYCGSAGILFPDGDFKLSVLIRTAVGEGENLSYFAGCGIVWDSVPEREKEEMHLKREAFRRAGERTSVLKG